MSNQSVEHSALLYFMERLKNNIISRLIDLKQLTRPPQLSVSTSQRPQSAQYRPAQALLRTYRLKQQQRIAQQLTVLEQIQIQQPSSHQVSIAILEIMTIYDPSFRQYFTSLDINKQPGELLNVFFSKHRHPQTNTLISDNEPSTSAAPYQYLYRLSQWSKTIFKEQFQPKLPSKIGARPMQNHSSQADTFSTRTTTDRVRTQQSIQKTNRLTFFSRQHLYSLIRGQLMNIYALHDCLDLDHEYLNRISKPKGVSCQKHSHEMVCFLAKQCNNLIGNNISNYRAYYGVNSQGEEFLDRIFQVTPKPQQRVETQPCMSEKRQIFRSDKKILPRRGACVSQKITKSKNTSLIEQNSLVKLKQRPQSPNPKFKDTFTFNFITKNDNKTRRQIFKQLNRTAMIFNNKVFSKDKSGKIETESSQNDAVSRSKHVVVMEMSGDLVGDAAISRARARLHSKQQSLKMTRQGLLGSRRH